MSNGSNMSFEEWCATRETRIRLAYQVGLVKWRELSEDQRDEAVRREVINPGDGRAYVSMCIRDSGAASR